MTPERAGPASSAASASPEALLAAANALLEQGKLDAAIASLESALKLRPDFAPASFTLAQALWMQGNLEGAAARLREGLEVMPQLAGAHNNLGLVYQALGRYDAAVESFRRALAVDPNLAWAHCNLGNTLQAQRQPDAAIESYRRALAIDPRHAEAHFNLGNVLKEKGDADGAVASYNRALALQPGNAQAHVALGSALQSQGELDAAIRSFRKALSLEPDRSDAHSGIVFTMSVDAGFSPEERLSEARRYGAAVASRANAFTRWAVDPADRSIGREQPLRVGLVSGDLRTHPVGFFVESVLRHLDAKRIELVAYSTLPHEDELSQRIKSRAAWRSIAGLTDPAAAEAIRADHIHVLIDLAGHTAHNRLPLFAWKPAPVQATWLGYFGTTGVPAIDYLIADRVSAPESARGQFTETVLHLPDSRFCFTPPSTDPGFAPGPLPALSSGYITFACFQNLMKLNDAVIAVWGRILRALPQAKLHVQNDALAYAGARARLQARLEAAGIAASRVTMAGSVPREAYLRAHAGIDVILDTFPYSGATTTCEALWMGVPTLTLAGDTLVSRQGASLLTCVGLAGWIAVGEDDYVQRAIALASDLESLAALRSRLRDQLVASPLCDAPRFARNLEQALQTMWEQGTARHPAAKTIG